MSKKKRTSKAIPNAASLASGLAEGLVHEVLERGRTLGRLEGIADAFEAANADWVSVTRESGQFLAPILREAIERLKSA